jgi:hypothetical protein
MKTRTSSLMDSHLVDFTNPNANNIKSGSTTSKKVIRIDDINEEVDEQIKLNEVLFELEQQLDRLKELLKLKKPIYFQTERMYSDDEVIEFTMNMISQYVVGNTNIWDRDRLKESLKLKKPTSSQTEISDEEIEEAAKIASNNPLLDWENDYAKEKFIEGVKWYREQLKQK